MNLTSLDPRGVVGPAQDALCQGYFSRKTMIYQLRRFLLNRCSHAMDKSFFFPKHTSTVRESNLVNCFCPTNWEQLTITDRKFGECYFLNGIDTNWEIGNTECTRLSPHREGRLALINSDVKSATVQAIAVRRWKELVSCYF